MNIINKPIEMVCIFSVDGKVTPFKFKVQDDFGENQLYTVKPVAVERNRTVHNYHCIIEKEGIEKKCTIYYYVQECKWVLYGIEK